jgi:hypothetical protein
MTIGHQDEDFNEKASSATSAEEAAKLSEMVGTT